MSDHREINDLLRQIREQTAGGSARRLLLLGLPSAVFLLLTALLAWLLLR